MVVKRKISTRRYIMVGVLTLLIFIPGLLLGIVIDNARAKSLQKEAQIQEIDFRSNQLSYLYLSYIQYQNNSCIALKTSLENSIKDLSKSLDKIEQYKQTSKFNDGEFDLLSRGYVLDNLNYWLLSKKTKELCGYDTVNILYFFDSECGICPNQGIILTYYKKKLEDRLLIFPINTDYVKDEPMIQILTKVYNITGYPAIVVDDTLYREIVNNEEMHAILCDKYSINETECESLLTS